MIKKSDITCPICSKPNTWKQDNLSRPFCSPRCKLIDLGEWADESRRVPGEPIPSPDDKNPDEN